MKILFAALTLFATSTVAASTSLRNGCSGRDLEDDKSNNCDRYSGSGNGICTAYLAQGCDIAPPDEEPKNSCTKLKENFFKANGGEPFYFDVACPCFDAEAVAVVTPDSSQRPPSCTISSTLGANVRVAFAPPLRGAAFFAARASDSSCSAIVTGTRPVRMTGISDLELEACTSFVADTCFVLGTPLA